MCTGVSKSGSPAPSPITSLPSAFNLAARAVTASVGEGLTRCTRRATDRVTGGFPVDRALIRAARLYYGITPLLTNLALPPRRLQHLTPVIGAKWNASLSNSK